jgi:hypothetical protein
MQRDPQKIDNFRNIRDEIRSQLGMRKMDKQIHEWKINWLNTYRG